MKARARPESASPPWVPPAAGLQAEDHSVGIKLESGGREVAVVEVGLLLGWREDQARLLVRSISPAMVPVGGKVQHAVLGPRFVILRVISTVRGAAHPMLAQDGWRFAFQW